MNKVIVVEGKDDTRRLREVFGSTVATIETNGSAIDQKTLMVIAKAHAKCGVIVFTDPDFAGQKIRNIIQSAIPTVQHAFLEQAEAHSSKKGISLGVEHANDAAIKRALASVYTVQGQDNLQDRAVTQTLLMKLGLVGTAKSSQLRDRVTQRLAIGHTNGKQLLKRLHMFGVTVAQLEEVVRLVQQETNKKEDD